MNLLLYLAAIGVACAWLVPLIDSLIHLRRMSRLKNIPPSPAHDLPGVSIVVPARDEAATIEPAMRTLLALDYPALEIVAVDDRSADATGAILDRLAASDPRLRVVHVSDLPAGWLGKNHAMHAGAAAASGRFILFTDADVHLSPDTLRRAVPWMERDALDHLVVGADTLPRNWLERAVIGFFMCCFVIRFRPWHVPDPRSKAHIGIGAFNLVRTDVYRAAGGHRPLAMEVLDDVKLGKLMKAHGARARFAESNGMVRVRWVEGVSGIFRGMEKNAFAGFGFNPLAALGGAFSVIMIACWPWIGLFLGPWPPRAISLLGLLAMFAMSIFFSPDSRRSSTHAFGFPIAGFVLAATFIRSMAATYRRGGIVWRGTLYRLDELKKGIY